MIETRPERPADHAAVRRINVEAFGRPDEADLVERLRAAVKGISLVAEVNGEVAGHLLLTPVALDADLDVWGLAPMAVDPSRQRQGLGAALVRAGLAACRDGGADAVVVLGHPAYYPRFGFRRASAFGLSCEYDVPDEAFLAIELTDDAFDGADGLVRYHPAFSG